MKLDKPVVIGAIAAVVLLAVGGGLAAYVLRDTQAEAHTIQIGIVQQLVKANRLTQVKKLKLLSEQIRNFLESRAGRIDQAPGGAGWTAVPNAQHQDGQIKPLYDHELLRTSSRFVGVHTHTYKVARDRDPSTR